MSGPDFMIARNRIPSHSTEVVGAKTREALEQDWISHFRENSTKFGRPEGGGWMTIREMADQAGVDRSVIQRYLNKHESNYEKEEGTINARKTTYYRFKIPEV